MFSEGDLPLEAPETKVIASYVKTVLYCAVRPKNKNNTLAVTILDHLYTNEYILDNEQRISSQIAANLDKVNFIMRQESAIC